MATTTNLIMPLIAAAQSQKHITHNDAIIELDAVVQLSVKSTVLTAPPGSPAEGDRYLIGSGPTGAWAGKDLNITYYASGAWVFLVPRKGWLCWDEINNQMLVWIGASWSNIMTAAGVVTTTTINNNSLPGKLTILGLGGATADSTNRLSINSPAALFNNAGSNMRLTVNKNAAANDAGFTFQTNFSTRALFGLLADDNFTIKVSPDGSSFTTAVTVLATNGRVGIGTTSPSQQLEVAGDVVINGVLVGRGGGNSTQNTASGVNALRSNTIGTYNTASGVDALQSNTTGALNTASGAGALQSNTTGTQNTASGVNALRSNTIGTYNTASGVDALQSNTTGVLNTASGVNALRSNTTGELNTASGVNALQSNTTGALNTASGVNALQSNTTGTQNTASGVNALLSNTTFDNCSGFGYNAQVTGSNQIQLGDSSTTTYVYGAVQNRSDARDKTDIRPTAFGLDFLNRLTPVDYRLDYREDYLPSPVFDDKDPSTKDYAPEPRSLANIKRDGSKARRRIHSGLIAQDVRAVLDELGLDWAAHQDHSICGGDDVQSLGMTQFIAPLIRAIQELSAKVDSLTAPRQKPLL